MEGKPCAGAFFRKRRCLEGIPARRRQNCRRMRPLADKIEMRPPGPILASGHENGLRTFARRPVVSKKPSGSAQVVRHRPCEWLIWLRISPVGDRVVWTFT
jgi:hypothetical protein